LVSQHRNAASQRGGGEGWRLQSQGGQDLCAAAAAEHFIFEHFIKTSTEEQTVDLTNKGMTKDSQRFSRWFHSAWTTLRLLNCRRSLVVQHSQHHLISSYHQGQGAGRASHLILITEDQGSRQRISSQLDHRGARQWAAHRSVSRSQRRLSRYGGRRSEGCSRSQKSGDSTMIVCHDLSTEEYV
jgi:hypothetical protein